MMNPIVCAEGLTKFYGALDDFLVQSRRSTRFALIRDKR